MTGVDEKSYTVQKVYLEHKIVLAAMVNSIETDLLLYAHYFMSWKSSSFCHQ